ncbi:hypothetical protein CR513_17422, partial [Mucuna pruriens]
MTRKRNFDSLHPFDPEIEKTLNRIRKSNNMHVGHSSDSRSSIPEIDNFEIKPNFSNNPLYESDPMENNNKTLKELATSDVLYQPWCIQMLTWSRQRLSRFGLGRLERNGVRLTRFRIGRDGTYAPIQPEILTTTVERLSTTILRIYMTATSSVGREYRTRLPRRLLVEGWQWCTSDGQTLRFPSTRVRRLYQAITSDSFQLPKS